MNDTLSKYMEKRLSKEPPKVKKRPEDYGPVITISRQYGCPAKKITEKLAEALNAREQSQHTTNNWTWVGKEIFAESARSLNVETELITDIASRGDSGLLNEILRSYTHKYYPGDIKVKKTIGAYIRSMAEEGHRIILGRGGVSICHDIKKSLHVRIYAPLDYRVNVISRKYEIPLTEAERRINEIDKKREALRHFFEKGKPNELIFDVMYNGMTLSIEEIVASIKETAIAKGIC
ncbi:MAG TPA: hypothetical protein DDY13_18365 [Cytophagales bacterium]|jgi:cytidylate kinase|nr:hypothetical protein [Cytophagales bacterium]